MHVGKFPERMDVTCLNCLIKLWGNTKQHFNRVVIKELIYLPSNELQYSNGRYK